jgi:hypothetical protein
LQPSFYVTISTFAAGFVLYKSFSEDSWISGLISKFTPDEKIFEQRNAIRTAAQEKVAADRHLFFGAPSKDFVQLKDPEYVKPLRFPFCSHPDLRLPC